MLGWGSTYGPIGAGCRRVRALGRKVAQAHLRHLNPLPANLGEVLARYRTVVVPEMNLGQLALLLRGRYLVDVRSYTKVSGLPFKAEELQNLFLELPQRHWGARMTAIDLGLPQLGGLDGVPTTDEKQTAKDFTSDQEVRWCPGCGDYAVLAAVPPVPAHAGHPAREHRVRVRHRLLARGSRTTSTPTGCTRSTAAPRPSPPGSR